MNAGFYLLAFNGKLRGFVQKSRALPAFLRIKGSGLKGSAISNLTRLPVGGLGGFWSSYTAQRSRGLEFQGSLVFSPKATCSSIARERYVMAANKSALLCRFAGSASIVL